MDLNKKIWPTSYVSAPKIPAWWKRDLDRIGGYNQFARPNLKLVWAMDEHTFENDNPNAMKYANPNDTDLGWACFILERYAEPGTFFNETLWNQLRYGAVTRERPSTTWGRTRAKVLTSRFWK